MKFWSKLKSDKYRFHSRQTKDQIVADMTSLFQTKHFDLTTLLTGRLTSKSTFDLFEKTFMTKLNGKTQIKGVLNYYPKSTEIVIEVLPNDSFMLYLIIFFLLGIVFLLFSFLEPSLNFYKFFTGLLMTVLLPLFLANYCQLLKDDLVSKFEKKFDLQRLTI